MTSLTFSWVVTDIEGPLVFQSSHESLPHPVPKHHLLTMSCETALPPKVSHKPRWIWVGLICFFCRYLGSNSFCSTHTHSILGLMTHPPDFQLILFISRNRWNLSTPVVQWLSYSPLDPRFAGSIPARVDGFFESVKILSMTSFRRAVKPWVPGRRFTARKRTSRQN